MWISPQDAPRNDDVKRKLEFVSKQTLNFGMTYVWHHPSRTEQRSQLRQCGPHGSYAHGHAKPFMVKVERVNRKRKTGNEREVCLGKTGLGVLLMTNFEGPHEGF